MRPTQSIDRLRARVTRARAAGLAIALTLSGALAQASTPEATPQLTREDYARAEGLLPDRTSRALLNERVIPHWIGTRDEFWYLRETPEGHEFVIVDATNGRKRPAFDHRALAAALSAVTAQPVSAAKLPFETFALTDGKTFQSLQVTVKGQEYECTMRPARCRAAASTAIEGAILSPDGKWAAFTRGGNLWLREIASGRERALTTDGESNRGYGITSDGWQASYIPRARSGKQPPPLESYWSPDSKRFIVSHVDQRHVAEYPFLETAPDDGSFRPKVHRVRIPLVGERPPTLTWFAFDIPSGTHRRIEYPYDQLLVMQQDLLAIRKTWWNEDNSHLYAVAFGANMGSAFLFDVDLATGAVRTVIEERMTPRMDLNSTSYNPPNVSVTRDGGEAIWFSQRDGWGHLYLYDTRTGALKNRITEGEWLVRDLVHIDEQRRRIYFTGSGREPGNPYYRYLYRVNFDGSDLTLLSPEPGDHLITSPGNDVLLLDGAVGYDVISPSGRFVVYNYSPMQQPTRSVIRTTSDARLVATVEQADATRLFAAGYRPPEEFVVKAADGKTDLYGVMYKPANFDPARKYPIIDAQYGSPLTAVVPRSFNQAAARIPGFGSPASTAQLGFIVVVVDARGTPYRSREFADAGFARLHINGLDDHVAAIRQLAERFPFIDLTRVGITGASYGGWTALRAMLEFPDFYKVGVAGVPPGSMHSMYLDYHWTAYQGAPKYSDGGELRPTPTEVPDNWAPLDGPKQVARLAGKLLIVMGELDENVPPGSTLQFVDALIKEDKDFELLYLPNSNHGGGGTYVTRRMWDFFVRHLLGTEPPQYRMQKLEES